MPANRYLINRFINSDRRTKLHTSLTNVHANRYSVKSVRSDSSTRLFAPKLSALCSNKQPHVLPSLLNLFSGFASAHPRSTYPISKMQCPTHLAAMLPFGKTYLPVLTILHRRSHRHAMPGSPRSHAALLQNTSLRPHILHQHSHNSQPQFFLALHQDAIAGSPRSHAALLQNVYLCDLTFCTNPRAIAATILPRIASTCNARLTSQPCRSFAKHISLRPIHHIVRSRKLDFATHVSLATSHCAPTLHKVRSRKLDFAKHVSLSTSHFRPTIPQFGAATLPDILHNHSIVLCRPLHFAKHVSLATSRCASTLHKISQP